MAQRRFHYEVAFEHYLRAKSIPYVAVDEAKRAMVDQSLKLSLKSFDFVVYSKGATNLLVDVKGRKVSGTTGGSLQNWVTEDDVKCLVQWEKIFGNGFAGAFVFLFWCEQQPPDALFQEMFEFGEKWYAVQTVRLADYQANMTPRSAKWETVSLPSRKFAEVARPLGELL